jgi:hypothetical protein
MNCRFSRLKDQGDHMTRTDMRVRAGPEVPDAQKHFRRQEVFAVRSTGIAYGWVFGLLALSFSKS